MSFSDTSKFETWIGAIVLPNEPFTLVIDHKENKNKILNRLAKIGYEKQVKKVPKMAKTAQIIEIFR